MKGNVLMMTVAIKAGVHVDSQEYSVDEDVPQGGVRPSSGLADFRFEMDRRWAKSLARHIVWRSGVFREERFEVELKIELEPDAAAELQRELEMAEREANA